MNLNLTDKHILVCGASSGFGKAITERLLDEGASVTAVARTGDSLSHLKESCGDRLEFISMDLFDASSSAQLLDQFSGKSLYGLVLNAGGPPVGKASELEIEKYDRAYQTVVRWKIDLVLKLLPLIQKSDSGRILFIESQSLKQPIPNLVLSNSMRLAVAGFAKTLSAELAGTGITVNLMAPGSHDTPAINRIIDARAKSSDKNRDDVKKEMESAIPVGRFGKAEEFASLAAWLLSSHSAYITGQTISHDGGSVRGIFG